MPALVAHFSLPPERPAPKPTRIILIRHGQCAHNAADTLPAEGEELSLTDQGRQEAELTRAALANEQVDYIYASPTKRTQETASIIFPGRKVITLPELRDRNLGSWNGKSREEIQRENPEGYTQYRESGEVAAAGAERLREFQERCMKVAEAMVIGHTGQTIVAVTHSQLIKGVTAFVAGRRRVFRERLQTCGITVLDYDRLAKSYDIVKFNDAVHLSADAK